jgi:hypothetical protein
MNRKIELKIEGLGKFEGLWTPELVTESVTQVPEAKEDEVSIPKTFNITTNFYDFLASKEVFFELKAGDTYTVDRIKSTNISSKKIIYCKDGFAKLVIGIENYDTEKATQSGHLITLKNGAEILIENVHISQPPQIYSTQPWMPSLFRSSQDQNAKWAVVIKNNDNGENGGFGVGFVYGGLSENNIALIDWKFKGVGLMDAKNPYPGCVLNVTIDNVNADYTNLKKWGDNKTLVKGIFKNDTFTVTEGFNFEFLNNYNFQEDSNSNSSFLIHSGRFTFQIDRNKSLLDWNTCKLRPRPFTGENVTINKGRAFFIGKEPQAGDIFYINGTGYIIKEKNRTYYTDWTKWGDDKNLDLAFQLACFTDAKLPEDGIYTIEAYEAIFYAPKNAVDAYLVFKANFDFRSYPTTEFGDREILSGATVGHLCYNHDVITLWAKDSSLLGYYRQTQDNGKTNGYNMVNCVGFENEFNPPVEVTKDKNKPMPQVVLEMLAWTKEFS